MLTPILLLLTSLLVVIGAEKEIVLGSGIWGSGRGGSTRNHHGFSALRAIVTGIAHSGTTLISKLLFNAPCVIGAFETGFLLAETPRDIREVLPWIKWHTDMKRKEMYMLKLEDIDTLAAARNFPEMLDTLRNISHLFNNLTDEPWCDKPYQMIDKTPMYIQERYFERILRETDRAHVPIVVVKKPYESLKKSWAKRKALLERQYYNMTYNNVERMISKYPNRIMVVNRDDLVLNVESVMQEVFEFVGLEWRSDYLKMTNLKKKFAIYGKHWIDHMASWAWNISRLPG